MKNLELITRDEIQGQAGCRSFYIGNPESIEMEWTKEAINAAMKTYFPGKPGIWKDESEIEDMRAALDAAVKAQEDAYIQLEIIDGATYRQARAEALEEAANVADEYGDLPGRAAAAAIRALK